MTLPDAMAFVLSEHPEGLTVSELARVVSIQFPDLLQTRGRKASPIGLTPLQALTTAISSAAHPSAKRFGQDTSVVPMRIVLKASRELWSSRELQVAVRAYLDMRDLEMSGREYVKATVYRRIATLIGRSEKSIELRMRNISTVLSLTGHRWIRGLLPARNVGPDVALQIEAIIAAEEMRPPSNDIVYLARLLASKTAASAHPAGAVHSERREAIVVQYVRDPAVRDWVLQTANGVCELCRDPAPFLALSGAYLEVHHVRRLADGGADCIENAVAVCPNCHRRLHFGVDAPKQIDELYKAVVRLRR